MNIQQGLHTLLAVMCRTVISAPHSAARALCTALLLWPLLAAQAQPASNTSLASSANPSAYGQSVTLAATVTGNAPTGSVTFVNGSTTLGTAALVDGAATLNTGSLGIGTHSLSAVYGGDANNAGSTSATLTQVVGKAATTSTVTSNANPSGYGSYVNFTASVTGMGPTGSVSFMDGATNLGSASLSGAGNTRTAVLSRNSLGLGSHSITVVYNGDANNAVSTSPVLTQTIDPANTGISVSASPGSSTYNTNVTFTSYVSGQSPTGSVTFMDGTTTLGTAAVGPLGMSRGATLTTNTLAIGSHPITAAYSGDTNNKASTSSVLNYIVNKFSTTTVLATSTNPSTYGQSVTLTATVTGAGNPGGTVTFKESSTTLGTAPIVDGVATFSTSALLAGGRTLYANYNGDASNAVSSGYKAHTVSKMATTVSLSSSLTPSTVGQSVTYTAVVNGVNPTGNIVLKDGTASLGTFYLGNGSNTITYTSASLPGGNHNLTAVYSGDTNHLGSTSAEYVQVVNPKAVTLTLNTSHPSPTLGSNVTLSVVFGGAHLTPTGTITFYDAGAPLTTANVPSSLTLNTLGVGTHTLTASYSGDASNLPVTSNPVTVTVTTGMSWQDTSWSYGYDATGRLNTVIDPFGQANYRYYDRLGRLIQTQQPPKDGSTAPTVIGYNYDASNALTQVLDPRNLATNYTPDGLGQVTGLTSPDSGASQYTYDAAGNVRTFTDARGKTTTYSYDALNRLTAASYPTGVPTTFEYDGGSSPSPAAAGKLTKMADESGQTVYAYDALGRLSTKTVTIAGRTFTVSYSWGDSGGATNKLAAVTYPSGSRVNYSYDQTGRMSGITVNPVNANGQGASATVVPLLSGVTYNADSRVTGWLWSDGKLRTIGYDSHGQISSYSLGDPTGTGNSAGLLRSIQRDAAGRIIGYTHTNNGVAQAGFDQSFGYDKLDRLTRATQGVITTHYSYDATGNRAAKTIGGTTYAHTVSATSNRLAQVQDPTGTATIHYDSAGNTVGDGSFTYAYSDRGRMGSATTASGTVTYLYDGNGQRVKKSGPTALVVTGASHFVYDEAGQLLGEYDANGNSLYETIYLGSTPVGAMKQAGSAATSDVAVTLYNVHSDHIDTPRVITRQDQTIVWRWDAAEAFGATSPDQNPTGLGAFAFNQRFPGQVFDAETGLFQNWNREYDPTIGGYIQSDPIGLAGGINTYGYVNGDPISGFDPDGLYERSDIAGAYSHYCRGSGNSWTTPYSSINWGDLDRKIEQYVRSKLGNVCTPQTIAVSDILSAQTEGADKYIIGRHAVKLTGTIEVKCNCEWEFKGEHASATGADPYDFNASNRSLPAELLTWAGRNACRNGRSFNINIIGKANAETSGKIDGAQECMCKR